MKAMGVQDSGLAQSLGVFAIVLIGMITLVVVFFLLNARCLKIEKLEGLRQTIVQKLRKKLFFDGFVRYMILSNLKVTYTVTAFLLSAFSFATFMAGVKTTMFMIAFLGVCVWPIFIAWFVYKNKERLDDETVSKKWGTLYQGIHTNQLSALMYNAVFCARRFDIVLVNMLFSPNFPLTGFSYHQYVFKCMSFLIVQTFYVFYIMHSKPHTENVFNKLELFNELMIILMCYIMLVFSGIGDRDNIIERKEPLVFSVAISAILIIVNLYVMVKLSATRIIQEWRLKKYRKLMSMKEEDECSPTSASKLFGGKRQLSEIAEGNKEDDV